MGAEGTWREGVEEDHQLLASQVGALEAVFTMDARPQDRHGVLNWISRNLWPALELHLRKEGEVLLPALAQVLGKNAAALTLFKKDHQELRDAHRRLAEHLQTYEQVDWVSVRISSCAFIDLLEDHEKQTARLLLDVLGFNLKPKELEKLAHEFEQVAKRAYEEEGWPAPWRSAKIPSGRLERRLCAEGSIRLAE